MGEVVPLRRSPQELIARARSIGRPGNAISGHAVKLQPALGKMQKNETKPGVISGLMGSMGFTREDMTNIKDEMPWNALAQLPVPFLATALTIPQWQELVRVTRKLRKNKEERASFLIHQARASAQRGEGQSGRTVLSPRQTERLQAFTKPLSRGPYRGYRPVLPGERALALRRAALQTGPNPAFGTRFPIRRIPAERR